MICNSYCMQSSNSSEKIFWLNYWSSISLEIHFFLGGKRDDELRLNKCVQITEPKYSFLPHVRERIAVCRLATDPRIALVKTNWSYWRCLQLPNLGVMPRCKIKEDGHPKLLLWLVEKWASSEGKSELEANTFSESSAGSSCRRNLA